MDLAANFAKVTLATGYDASATEVDILTGEGERLPSSTPYNLVWWNATDFPDPADDPTVEIVRVTARTDETLTITRAQEGTAAQDHNVAGKTYKMVAGLTAKVVNSDIVGDVHGSGPALIFDSGSNTITLRQDGTAVMIQLGASGIGIQCVSVNIGDVEGEGSFTQLTIDDSNTRIILKGRIATNQIAAASTSVGTLVGKVPWYDDNNTLIGYMPVYGSIT